MNLKTRNAPFKLGQRVRCLTPTDDLCAGEVYTVTDTADLGPPTRLLALRERPGLLFHPTRFVKLSEPEP